MNLTLDEHCHCFEVGEFMSCSAVVYLVIDKQFAR